MKSSFNIFFILAQASTKIQKEMEDRGKSFIIYLEKYELFIPSGFECMLKIIISFYHLLKSVKGENNITDLLISLDFKALLIFRSMKCFA